jgi:hypothetical protein
MGQHKKGNFQMIEAKKFITVNDYEEIVSKKLAELWPNDKRYDFSMAVSANENAYKLVNSWMIENNISLFDEETELAVAS